MMKIFQQVLLMVAVVALVTLTATFYYFTFKVVPPMMAWHTHLVKMQECSRRSAATIAEIDFKTTAYVQNLEGEQKDKTKAVLEQTYANLNSPEFYADCQKTVEKEWDLN
jgi:hypothetical protein